MSKERPVHYTYDEARRLLSAGDVTYEYDAAGRLTRRSGPEIGRAS
ncbi:MAG TPA: hypothetical protein DHW14_03515, partial [Clostridiales bacterium]|nr:hypothetical protein [Clostridiales bacterium]